MNRKETETEKKKRREENIRRIEGNKNQLI